MFRPKQLTPEKWLRIRRTIRWMRPLPRKSNIHKYPILKNFSKTARKRLYLWSFRSEHVIPAIYAGCILAFMPIIGVQLIVGFFLSVILRANLMVISSLVFITNPLTVFFIYYLNALVGKFFFELVTRKEIEISLSPNQIYTSLTNLGGKDFFTLFTLCSIGAFFLGYVLGLILTLIYKFYLSRRKQAS